jgi:hypothetical protein
MTPAQVRALAEHILAALPPEPAAMVAQRRLVLEVETAPAPRYPASALAEEIDWLLALHGTSTAVAAYTGLAVETISSIVRGETRSVYRRTYDVIRYAAARTGWQVPA